MWLPACHARAGETLLSPATIKPENPILFQFAKIIKKTE
jgi:hypothetical protein